MNKIIQDRLQDNLFKNSITKLRFSKDFVILTVRCNWVSIIMDIDISILERGIYFSVIEKYDKL